MLRNPFQRIAGLVLFASLLAGNVSAQAPESLPQAPNYRGEIRRGADGKLTVLPDAAPGEVMVGANGVASEGTGRRVEIPVRRVDPGPPDMSCLAGGVTLSATERALVSMPADSWMTLPGTAFGDFCKAREKKALRGVGGCTMVINAWSGGVFDERLRMLLVIGGGHMDYWGNEVYGFDLATGRWTMVTTASGLGTASGPTEPMPDGSPVSRHTYDGLAYMRHLGKVFMFGGATAPTGYSVNSTWWFDSTKGIWNAKSNAPNTGAGHYYMASAYDPLTRKVYVRNERVFISYDPEVDRWSSPIVDFKYPPYYPRMSTHHYRRGVILPGPRLFLAAGGSLKNPDAPDVFVYHLDERREVTSGYPMTGDTSVVSVAGLGLDVEIRTGSLVAWAGGAPAIMDPVTWHWRRGSARGAPLQAVEKGTYGRFRYVPYLNVFILVNKPEEDVHFYKLSAGCGPKATMPSEAVRR